MIMVVLNLKNHKRRQKAFELKTNVYLFSSITFLISLFFIRYNSEMPRNLYCNVLGSSLNVQNLVSKILQTFGFKSLVSRLGLGPFKSRSRLEFLLKVAVSQRQCLDSVSKNLAETPALLRTLLPFLVLGEH